MSELPAKPHEVALLDALEETALMESRSTGVESSRFWFSEP
jgi:hypothetical protein